MRFVLVLLVVLFAACAAPPRYGEVVTFKAGEAPAAASRAPGTVWRLDEADLKALSPAPLVPAPPPPRIPPPRPDASHLPPPGYGPPPMYRVY